MLDKTRWQEIKEVLDTASHLPEEARTAFVDERCAEDPALRDEVLSLLTFNDPTHELLDQPVFDLHAQDPAIGRRIDHYRIVKPLGRGGMGKVYLAEREDDFSKEVALKVIQPGTDAEDRIARFHEERQILADVEHPAIARLLDGGTGDDGLPYLVMEWIDGVPIDRYCDDNRLSVRRRLELFRRVLDAVGFAHRHLIVHRDLKPSNILVTPDGDPKLIDFGIAKLLQPGNGDTPATARPNRMLMSPRYASPEQARGERLTTASDVYSLGILLYELLSGCRPYGQATTDDEELLLEVCYAKPPPPSLGFGSLEQPEEAARNRATSVRTLKRQLGGELDAIVLEAIAKKPEDRYASAERFAEDIDFHLTDRPVRAHPHNPFYRGWKYARRNRTALAAAVLALVALAALAGVYGLHTRVERERVRNEAIAGFVESLFRGADPDRTDGRELTVLELLERGDDHLERGLENQPLTRSALLAVVGRVYEDLGEWEKAAELIGEALDLQRRHDPGDRATMARLLNDLATASEKSGDLDRAESLYREALDLHGGCDSEHPDAFWTAGNLAGLFTQKGDLAEAEALLTCLGDPEVWSQDPNLEPEKVAGLLTKFAVLRFEQKKLGEAETFLRRSLQFRREYFGSEHTKVANSLNNLGRVLQLQGRNSEAEPLLREALEIRRKLLSTDHQNTANTEKNLALVLLALDHPAEALPLARHAFETLSAKLESDDQRLAEASSVLAECLAALEPPPQTPDRR